MRARAEAILHLRGRRGRSAGGPTLIGGQRAEHLSQWPRVSRVTSRDLGPIAGLARAPWLLPLPFLNARPGSR